MPKIHKLPSVLVAQIAAGEVIDSPTGALKELLDNAVDAKATEITVHLEGLGFRLIQVQDNGIGIAKEDLPLAVESFATSKIHKLEDLFQIESMGFRGEALGSIRSVSHLTIESKAKEEDAAFGIEANAQGIEGPYPVAYHDGTRVKVEDLFFNMPVRREFQKNPRKLKKDLLDLVSNFALAHPSIRYRLFLDGTEVFDYDQANSLTERVRQIYGKTFANHLIPVFFDSEYQIQGFISSFDFYKSGGGFIKLFVNGRLVQYRPLVGLLRYVYGELMPPGRFPVAFLFLKIKPEEIDVNVHPQKKEIKFKNEQKVYEFIKQALRNAIDGEGPIPMRHVTKQKPDYLSHSAEEKGVANATDLLLPLSTHTNSEIKKPEVTYSHFLLKAHARLFDTFVLASSEDGIYLIDQHTAHERINYEKFLRDLAQNRRVSQRLVHPISLHLSDGEKSLLQEADTLLEKLGFEVEDFGPAGYSLVSVPFYIERGQEEHAFLTALRIFEKGGKQALKEHTLFDELAKSLSCRHAIRKGEQVSAANMQELVQKLQECENPARCPHGRPTMIFLSRDEIFKMFKR
ncbi:MAG: DNA mismatch repair endonuclease MutL [Candidatus Hydrogenedentota bacterium]|nr:MAG: DNA mismatch repair endonuclease MutL [Candidatus Hydrogenedentota bacterium]